MAEDEPARDPKLPEDARLDSLDERLRRAQAEEAARTGKGRSADRNEQLGNRVLSYLIGGLGGGAVIGFAIDTMFGTSPWFLLGLLFLGTVAGFWSIIRISNRRPN
jgi:ATP synthase protein I